MWAGVIWKRKIVFGKFRHKAAPKNYDIVCPNLPMECSENAFWAITPTPNLPPSKPLYPKIHWSQLHLLAHAVPICFEHMLCVVTAKCTFLVALCRRNAHFLDPCITACSSS